MPIWTAITGAIGYGALVTSDVVPIQQFGAILATCTFVAAVLVMLISPIAMLPPFRLEVPVRHGSHSPVAGLMNRLVLQVYRHPAAIVLAVFAVVLPLAIGMFRLSFETNYINLFRPETRVVKDYHTVESKLGGIGLVELVVPVGKSLSSRTLHDLKEVEDQIGQIKVTDPQAIAQVLSLATVLDPDGRLAALPASGRDRLLADKLELIAASPQRELLQSFWNADAGQTRILIRLKEQMPAPDKSRIFRESTAAAAAKFGPSSYLTGLSFLMTRTTEAIIATQWGTFLWSAAGILLMLTLAFRSLILAFLAIMPTLLSVALVLGLMGWLKIKLDMATALVASVTLGLSVDDTFHCLLQFHRQRKEPVSGNALAELPRERQSPSSPAWLWPSASPRYGPASSSHSSTSGPWSASRLPAARWATWSFSPPASPWASAGDQERSLAGGGSGSRSIIPADLCSHPAACPE